VCQVYGAQLHSFFFRYSSPLDQRWPAGMPRVLRLMETPAHTHFSFRMKCHFFLQLLFMKHLRGVDLDAVFLSNKESYPVKFWPTLFFFSGGSSALLGCHWVLVLIPGVVCKSSAAVERGMGMRPHGGGGDMRGAHEIHPRAVP
jgi:hypothetical protein